MNSQKHITYCSMLLHLVFLYFNICIFAWFSDETDRTAFMFVVAYLIYVLFVYHHVQNMTQLTGEATTIESDNSSVTIGSCCSADLSGSGCSSSFKTSVALDSL